MLFITHILVGMFLGHLMGNIWLVAFGAVIVDIDHLIPMLLRGVIFSPRKIWYFITLPHDPYGEQRTPLHSLLVWLVFTMIMFALEPAAAKFISIGYLSHLIIDSLDSDGLQLAWPLKKRIKGPLVYNSELEYLIDVALVVIVFVFIYFF